jgi:hypothetical protein
MTKAAKVEVETTTTTEPPTGMPALLMALDPLLALAAFMLAGG